MPNLTIQLSDVISLLQKAWDVPSNRPWVIAGAVICLVSIIGYKLIELRRSRRKTVGQKRVDAVYGMAMADKVIINHYGPIYVGVPGQTEEKSSVSFYPPSGRRDISIRFLQERGKPIDLFIEDNLTTRLLRNTLLASFNAAPILSTKFSSSCFLRKYVNKIAISNAEQESDIGLYSSTVRSFLRLDLILYVLS